MWDFIDWIRTDILNSNDWSEFSDCVSDTMQEVDLRFFNNVMKFSP